MKSTASLKTAGVQFYDEYGSSSVCVLRNTVKPAEIVLMSAVFLESVKT